MTIKRYCITLFLTALVLALPCSFLSIVTLAHLVPGTVIEETRKNTFTLAAGPNRYYVVSPALKADLEKRIEVTGTGALRVLSAKVEITPQKVTWSTGRNSTDTAEGGLLTSVIRWETIANAPSGSAGEISVKFPGYTPTLHSGGYEQEGDHYLFRHVTVHEGGMSVTLARLAYAFWFSVPLAFVVQGTWMLFVLYKLNRVRTAAAALPTDAPLPRTFLPKPVAEWQVWTILLLVFGAVGSIMAVVAVLDGFVNAVMWWFVPIVLGIGVVIALICVWFIRRSVVTVKIDAESFAYSKGRGAPRWIEAPWGMLRSVTPMMRKSRYGQYEWLEIVYPGEVKRRIYSTYFSDYGVLRDTVIALFNHHHQPPAEQA